MKELKVLPLTLYEFKAPDHIHNLMVEYSNSLDWEKIAHRNNEQHYGKTTDQFIHKDKKIKNFILWQDKQIKKVKEKENFVFCESFKGVSMWINKSFKNEWHHRHWHSWSFLSSIYFVSGESGDTWFSRETEYYKKNMQLQECSDTEICYVHKFKPGTLLVFPSSLEHSVSENLSDVPRTSISTNYLPTGKVGMGMGYTSDCSDLF
jgi:hypothetical protein